MSHITDQNYKIQQIMPFETKKDLNKSVSVRQKLKMTTLHKEVSPVTLVNRIKSARK